MRNNALLVAVAVLLPLLLRSNYSSGRFVAAQSSLNPSIGGTALLYNIYNFLSNKKYPAVIW
jgi:hypothetical protein